MRRLRPFSAVVFLVSAVMLSLASVNARAEFVSLPGSVKGDVRATCDLPAGQHHRNVGGSDGSGLCVYTAAWHAALWQCVHDVYDFRDWMKRRPGGSYPEKFTATLEAYCREKGIPVPAYVQCTTGDVEFLKLALRTGRMPCVTYCGADNVYYNGVIAHMVNLVYLDDKNAAILDNNYPGKLLWMTAAEFIARWTGVKENGQAYTIRGMRVGGGWAIVMLASPPPPYAKPPVSSLHEDRVLTVDIEQGPANGVLYGQCGPNGCNLRPATIASPNNGPYEWKTFPDPPGKNFLFQGGRFLGVVKPSGEWFPTLDGGRTYANNPSGEPPIPPPASENLVGQVDVPNGVDFDKLASSIPYQCDGKPCKRRDMFAAVGGLEDDSKRFNLSVVGPKSFQDRVKADLAKPEASKYAARIHVIYMEPGEWPVTQFGLPRGLGLRKPAEGRIGADVGSVSDDLYDLMKLIELLSQMDPKPPAPPVDPNAPTKPAGPIDWKWILIAILAGFTLFGSGKAPESPAPQTTNTK